MENKKYNKMSYGELNLAYIDRLKLKDFYQKSIKICPDESIKTFLIKRLINIEIEIENIKRHEHHSIFMEK